jgi:BMFP domain-containing protein YqiC
MQTQNRIFDDLAKVAGGALTALGSLKQEIEGMIRDKLERYMADANFVRRDEFDAVSEMAAKARSENEKLEARIAALEEALRSKQ